MKYLRPRRRQAPPPPDVGTAPGAEAELPLSTAADTEQGTPAPPAEVPQETLGSPAVALEGTHSPRPDPVDNTDLLGKEPDLTPASPSAAPEEAPEPDPTDDTGLQGKEPDLTPSSPGEALQASADPDLTLTDV